MGPTAVIPYSHYCTTDHETNHDNFAGADHLDFAYILPGGASGTRETSSSTSAHIAPASTSLPGSSHP